MSPVYWALIILGAGQVGLSYAVFYLLHRTKPVNWSTLVVGDIVQVSMTRDRGVTHGSLEFRDLGYRLTKVKESKR